MKRKYQFFKNRKCQICGKTYTPTATTQKYCFPCAKENKKVVVRKSVKKYYDRKRLEVLRIK